jgi:outer membrane protein assembly factor BamB
MFHHDSALSGYTTATAPNKMRVAWKFLTGREVVSSPAVVGGKVYVGSDDGYFYCLDGTTGALVWKYQTGNGIESSPAVVGDKVYFGSADSYVYCLTTGGSQVWKYKTGGICFSNPNVVGGKVYIGSRDNHFYCLDAATGTQIWNFTCGNLYREGAAVVANKVYFGTCDKKVYCLNATTGTQLWSFTGGDSFYSSSPTVAEGRVFIMCDNSILFTLNATTGAKLWQYRTSDDLSQTYAESSPAYAYGHVYAAFSHFLTCLNPATGAVLWGFQPGFIQRSSPCIADGKVFLSNNDRNLYIIDANTGNRLQTVIQFTGIADSSPAIADGKVYIGSSNSYVYCFIPIVPPVSTTISCITRPTSIPVSQGMVVEGLILPYPAFAVTVTLEFKKPDGTTLTASVGTTQDAWFHEYFYPDVPGAWSVKATWAGLGDFTGSTSSVANFTVTGTLPSAPLGATTISCWVAPTTLTLGETTYVRGGISGISNATVTLTYYKPDATSITRTVTTAADGTYEDAYEPTSAGEWQVGARWTGDATHKAASSAPITFTVTTTQTGASGQPVAAAGVPLEIVYGIVAVVVIAIIAIVAYMYLGRRKKT